MAALVTAFEALRGQLGAAGEARALLLQEGWTAVLGRALGELGAGWWNGSCLQCSLSGHAPSPHAVPPSPAAGGGASVLQRVTSRMLQPAFAGAALGPACEALRVCALRADAALAGLSRDAAALAALESVQRFALRASLPLFGPRAGLFLLPGWLERPVWQLQPSLAPTGLAGTGSHRTADCGRAVEAALQHLTAVHEAVEEAMRGSPEADRQAVCRGVLAAAAAAVLAPHLPAGDTQALLALHCLEPLVSRAGAFLASDDARAHVNQMPWMLAALPLNRFAPPTRALAGFWLCRRPLPHRHSAAGAGAPGGGRAQAGRRGRGGGARRGRVPPA